MIFFRFPIAIFRTVRSCWRTLGMEKSVFANHKSQSVLSDSKYLYQTVVVKANYSQYGFFCKEGLTWHIHLLLNSERMSWLLQGVLLPRRLGTSFTLSRMSCLGVGSLIGISRHRAGGLIDQIRALGSVTLFPSLRKIFYLFELVKPSLTLWWANGMWLEVMVWFVLRVAAQKCFHLRAVARERSLTRNRDIQMFFSLQLSWFLPMPKACLRHVIP